MVCTDFMHVKYGQAIMADPTLLFSSPADELEKVPKSESRASLAPGGTAGAAPIGLKMLV